MALMAASVRSCTFNLSDGSVSSVNITINPANPTVFFRLRYP